MYKFKPSLIALALTSCLLQAETDKAAWQVNAPQGEFSTVNIQVQQGSWMNVNVIFILCRSAAAKRKR
jgi:hypothetical protein